MSRRKMIEFGVWIATYGSIVLIACAFLKDTMILTSDSVSIFVGISITILFSSIIFILGGLTYREDEKSFWYLIADLLLLIATVILMFLLIAIVLGIQPVFV